MNVSSRCLLKWQKWSTASANRKIFSAACTVGSISLLVKMVSMVKERVVAGQFGTGEQIEAYLLAYILPSFAISIIISGFKSALIPTLIKVRDTQGKHAAQKLLSNTTTLSVMLLFLIAIALTLPIDTILNFYAPNFTIHQLYIVKNLYYILLPALIISGISSIWAAVLEANESFLISSLSSIAIPVSIILCLALLGGTWGIYALAASLVLGTLIECIVRAVALRNIGITLKPRWYGLSPETLEVINQYLPRIGGAILLTCSDLIDQTMAVRLVPGGLATLNYANKIVSVFVGLGSIALGTAVLPYFSKMVASANWESIKHTLRLYSRLILLGTIPVTAILIIYSNDVARLLFQGGAFTKEDVIQVAKTQSMLFIQIPFYMLGTLYLRLLQSFKLNKIIMYCAFINLVVNISLNIILSRYYGIAGIGLATSFVYIVGCIFLGYNAIGFLKKMSKLGD